MKLIAAMSGGVDSAVAAARAVEEGHDVIGVLCRGVEAPPQTFQTIVRHRKNQGPSMCRRNLHRPMVD
jgi:tRNA U34 2-thiouridine synthase MnmA/TrmU